MRKKTLGAWVAAGALALVGVGLGVRLWANDRIDSMPMFWAVHAAPDGRVLAELDDTLYIESPDGTSLGVIPLSRFGVKNFEGDFAVLSDDSVILQGGALPRQSVHDIVRALARTRDEAPDTDSSGAVPLQRCSLKTMQCTPMTGPGDYLKLRRTFKLCVDEQAERIYVADTEQQRLVMLDYTGKILATKDGALQFPNQLQFTAPGELTVVDTNHNRFVTFAVDGDKFGKELRSVPQSDWQGFARNDGYFPTGFVQMDDGTQWAIIARDNLMHGALYRRGSDGQPARIALPDGADVLSLATTGDEVLVPDNAYYRIHAFGRDGSYAGDFGSDTLNGKLDAFAEQHATYAGIFKYSLWAMLLLAGPLLLWAVRLQKAVDDETAEERAPDTGSLDRSGSETVDEASVQQHGTGTFLPLAGGLYQYRRQWGKGVPFDNPLGLAFMTVVVLSLPAMIGWMDVQVRQRHPQEPLLLLDWHFLLLMAMVVFMLVYTWSSYLYERVLVNSQGIGYQTLFSGPLAWLAFLRPSWAVRWQEIAEIRLCHRGKGRQPAAWYYLVKDRQGVTRRLSALSWRLADGEDGNPRYKPGGFMDSDTVHAAVYKTLLYRQLGRRGRA